LQYYPLDKIKLFNLYKINFPFFTFLTHCREGKLITRHIFLHPRNVINIKEICLFMNSPQQNIDNSFE